MKKSRIELEMESRSALQLFRDCIRLARHIGGDSAKGTALKAMVRAEFQKCRDETDLEKIDVMKGAAIRGLSNYMLMANAAKDPRFQNRGPITEKIAEYEERDVPSS